MTYQCKTPVIFIFFNRPDTMKSVLEKISYVKPSKIYFVSDGPRNEQEMVVVEQCRKVAENAIDWECKIEKIYSPNNMGCKKRVYSGITEVFEHEDKAIILEDDIVPNISFFRFMDVMLEKYQTEEKVMMVSGYNALYNPRKINKDSYFFSAYPSIWGWGTWKRAWDLIDIEMDGWRLSGSNSIKNNLPREVLEICAKEYDIVTYGAFDTWDFQWRYARQINDGIGIVPEKNLVRNIGFDQRATHTKKQSNQVKLQVDEMTFPIVYNDSLLINKAYDNKYVKRTYKKAYYRNIIKSILKKIFR